MPAGRGKTSTISDITINEDVDFLGLYKLLSLASPASGGALRKGNKDIANAEVSDTAGITEGKLTLAQGTQALFDKIGTDIGTHAGSATIHHTKTIDASELSAGILALARLANIANTQIAAGAAIAEAKLALAYATGTLFTKIGTDIGTHAGSATVHHTATVIADLSPIALSDIVNTYLLPTIMTTRGDLVYRGASDPGRIPAGTPGYFLIMGANDPAWIALAAGHIPALDVAKITTGRFGVARLPAMTDEMIWKGTGTNVEEVAMPVFTNATTGSYAGNNGANRAIPHGLGRTPKIVIINCYTGGKYFTFIQGQTGKVFWTNATSTDGQTVTIPNATNFYVGSAVNYDASGNATGSTYYWVAIG